MKIGEEIKQGKFMSPQFKAIINTLFTANWWSSQVAALLKPYGLSEQQYNILRILRGSYPEHLSVQSVKERMLDKTPNTTRLVDKLLVKNLVERQRCENDRRVVYINITEEGLTFMEEMDEVMKTQQIHEKINLTEEEAHLLSDLLDKLRS
ncbi:MarR family winged helix-turn-helix transcriptional regulator [Algivirga pacifica]|uniref:MarR family transcriptional regulator n=1 Tax=Algivirga pacifica TaxID=1162670 RepID=A0ABP9D8B4_9BACT